MSRLRMLGSISCAALAATLLAGAASSEQRAASVAAGQGATVIHNGVCDVGPGGVEIDGWMVQAVVGVAHEVFTPSGNIIVTCKAQLPAGTEPSRAIHLDTGPDEDFNCYYLAEDGTHIGAGTRGKQTWTPSGNVIARCEFKANQS